MHTDHIVNSIQHHDLVSDSTLHVVCMVSNPTRYHSRYRLFRDFVSRMQATANVQLHVVEVAFGDRHHEISGVDSLLQLRTTQDLWHKECALNLGVRHLLPKDWRYVAWIDGDVTFQNPNWALETIHALQHYKVVQPWSECADMGPYGNVMQPHRSFGSLVSGARACSDTRANRTSTGTAVSRGRAREGSGRTRADSSTCRSWAVPTTTWRSR